MNKSLIKYISILINNSCCFFGKILLFLSLLTILSCNFKIAENKKEEEWYARCGTTYKGYSVNFKRLENRMSYKYLLSFARYEDSTKSSFSGYFYNKLNHHSYFFVISDNDLESELSKFQDSLINASAEISVYIYINTINQELINQTFRKLAKAKEKVFLLNIHSDKEAKVNIPHISDFEYLAISGNVKECILDKETFPKCVNIFNAEILKKFECSWDSVQYFRVQGALRSEKIIEDICMDAKNLDTLHFYHNRLETMPNLGKLRQLKSLTYFDQDFDEIDLNRMPKVVDCFQLQYVKTNKIKQNKTEKKLKAFNLEGSIVPNLFETLLTLVEK